METAGPLQEPSTRSINAPLARLRVTRGPFIYSVCSVPNPPSVFFLTCACHTFQLARRAIQSIGKVGFKVAVGFELGVFEKLIEFLDLEVAYVRAEALLVLKDLLRKYPDRRPGVIEVGL